jgi:trimeric autotransporter adhesin
MAQVVKLKRTAVQGKVPTTSSLELGELAINTYDGRIFFEKDNGIPSVQSIVVTDAVITGSINLTGAVTASYFRGDGSNLINLPNADVSQVATVTASFDNQSNVSVTHNFNSRNVIVSVYDTAYSQIIPSSITLTDSNTADIVLSSAQSGFAVVAKGGHIVSGTLVQEVTEVATVTASFDNQSTISVTHSFGSKNILVSVYDTSDSQIIPSSVVLTNTNTATIGLSSPQSGYVVVAKGGHLVTSTGTISYNNLTDVPAGIISGSSGAPAGTISGSSQLTSSFDERYVLSGSITQTTWDNIASKPGGIISGSSQLTSSFVQNSQTSSMSVNYAVTASYAENIQISGSITNVKSIAFDRTAGVSVVEGQMAWNNSDGTLDIGLNYGDVVLQVGQEQHFVVRNATGTTISNGTAVYASGLSAGSKRIEVSPFTANGTTDEVRFLGLATHNISDGVNGVVSNFGYVRGLDTRGTSVTAISVGDETWAEGDILYAHPTAAGKLTKVAPKNKITVAMVTTRHQTTGVLFVRPSSFGHIDDLHDVQINTGSLVTGSMLEWNGDYFVNNNTFSSSINNSVSALNTLTGSLATTGSNTFVGTQTLSGSIIPAIDNTYDLGSPTYQWKDIYVSSGSLYIDGTKVLGSTGNELQITTDVGQSIKILEAGSDSIILQSADGDIQLKSSGGGNLLFDPTTGLIDVRGTLQIQDGNKITSSGGNSIQFGNDLGITGSITTSGNINGINLTTFSSSVVSTLSNVNSLNAYTSSLNTAFQVTGSKINFQGDIVVYGTQSIINSQNVEISDNILYLSPTASIDNDLGVVGHYNDGTYRHAGIFMDASDGHSWKVFKGLTSEAGAQIDIAGTGFELADFKAGVITGTSFNGIINSTNGVVSGSSQIVSILSPLNTFSASVESKNTTLGTYTSSLETKNSTLATYTGSIDTKNSTLATYTGSIDTKNNTLGTYTASIDTKNTTLGTYTASLETKNSTLATYTGSVNTSITALQNKDLTLATTGSNTFTGTISINSGTTGFLTLGASNSYGSISSGGSGATIYLNGATRGGTTTAASNTIVVATDGEFYITNGAANSTKFLLASNGNTTISGTFTENSSLRYKENVETIKYGLDKVLQMRGVTYDKKDNGVKEMGVIAEEIYEVLPELVLKNEEGEVDSVSYGRITAVLIEAIKDLKKEIEDLKLNR